MLTMIPLMMMTKVNKNSDFLAFSDFLEEVEAAFLVGEDVLHLLKAGHVIHGSVGLDHVHL